MEQQPPKPKQKIGFIKMSYTNTINDSLADFRDEILTHGWDPGQIIPDGKFHRFSTSDKQKDKAGWYVFNPSPAVCGCFGCWRTGEQHNWHPQYYSSLSAEEKKTIKRLSNSNLQRQNKPE